MMEYHENLSKIWPFFKIFFLIEIFVIGWFLNRKNDF